MYILLNEFLIDQPRWKVYTANELTIDSVNLFGWKQEKTLFEVRPHHHPNLFEFHFLQEGNFTFQVEGNRFNVSGGNVFITLPGEFHEAHFAIPSGHQFYWFQLRPSSSVLGLDEEKSKRLVQRLMAIRHRAIPFTPSMESAIQEAFLRSRSQDPYDQQYVETQLACFLYNLLEADTLISSLSVSLEIQQAIAYMKENLQHYIDVPSLAAYVGLSESYFRTKFKKELGLPPTDYYMAMRIDRAKQLLKEGYSVTETAMALDFSTPNYFSTVFHRMTNMTPTKYKKQG